MPSDQYKKTLTYYRSNIRKLKKQFNDRCAIVEERAEKEIARLDKNDKDAIRKIIGQEKQELSKIVREFDEAIHQNDLEARQKLESLDALKNGDPDNALNTNLNNIKF